ncbi:MAG: hypothetical protein QXP01_00065 [Candidatus Hadarchaeum sp.]
MINLRLAGICRRKAWFSSKEPQHGATEPTLAAYMAGSKLRRLIISYDKLRDQYGISLENLNFKAQFWGETIEFGNDFSRSQSLGYIWITSSDFPFSSDSLYRYRHFCDTLKLAQYISESLELGFGLSVLHVNNRNWGHFMLPDDDVETLLRASKINPVDTVAELIGNDKPAFNVHINKKITKDEATGALLASYYLPQWPCGSCQFESRCEDDIYVL